MSSQSGGGWGSWIGSSLSSGWNTVSSYTGSTLDLTGDVLEGVREGAEYGIEGTADVLGTGTKYLTEGGYDVLQTGENAITNITEEVDEISGVDEAVSTGASLGFDYVKSLFQEDGGSSKSNGSGMSLSLGSEQPSNGQKQDNKKAKNIAQTIKKLKRQRRVLTRKIARADSTEKAQKLRRQKEQLTKTIRRKKNQQNALAGQIGGTGGGGISMKTAAALGVGAIALFTFLSGDKNQ